MNLKDLIKRRDKLREYDELKEWRARFRNPTAKLEHGITCSCHGGCQEVFIDGIPDHNTIIEFNGEQHYKRCSIWQSEDDFFNQQERDRILREYCKQHKINLIEIPYTKIKDIDVILKTNIR